mmetsp:Transcript_12333/g.18486  ORF Transcript_12333/g.18486 Transcript_12333/m.18486 type:complete len:315 (-) Transcript_12333:16-960(-)
MSSKRDRSPSQNIPGESLPKIKSTEKKKNETYRQAFERVSKKNEELKELLDQANDHIEEIAREYKRLFAVAQSYKEADNSLLCTSQSQGTNQNSSQGQNLDNIPNQTNAESQLNSFDDLAMLSQSSDALFELASDWAQNYNNLKGKDLDFNDLVSFDKELAFESEVNDKKVRVGVGCIVIKDPDLVLIGLRKGSHGAGKWALPGGHLEVGESFAQCASRELKEETGMDIPKFRYASVTNDTDAGSGKHYVTVFMKGRLEKEIEPILMEPNKCSEWKWVSWMDLNAMAKSDSVLFSPLRNLIEQSYFAFEPNKNV